MKTKSMDSRQQALDQVKEYKSFDFVKLYKSAAENNGQFESAKLAKKNKKVNKITQMELDNPTTLRSQNKNKKKKANETLDLSQIAQLDLEQDKTNSTPNNKGEHSDSNVKSIMKYKCGLKDAADLSNINITSSNSKKRNKSVSFMLEDADEVTIKKIKVNETSKELTFQIKNKKFKEKVFKNSSKNKGSKKNKNNLNEDNTKENVAIDSITNIATKDLSKKEKVKTPVSGSDAPMKEEKIPGMKKKFKKAKKPESSEDTIESSENIGTSNQSSEGKLKKLKKKKRKVKSIDDSQEAEGEPAVKTRKKEMKPEVIAKDLENLNIGDNAHTLTSLIDEMSVVDKNKKKKDKKNKNKIKKARLDSNSEQGTQDVAAVKEKEKWSKRKWNKDKGDSNTRLLTSVVVENLPLKIMCTYKTLLAEYFGKFGTIAGIGVAETYPIEDPKPVFTTTVYFQDEEATSKALEEDNAMFQGSRVRVRRPLPPALSTLVVRSYGASTDQAISSLFSAAGRIRSIRHAVKGKNTRSTTFVEFDGPEAVERAIELAEDAKLGGKKILVAKYIQKTKNTGPNGQTPPNDPEANVDDDST